MKIGLLTFHNAINYGAILQACSLQLFLREHQVFIIDYSCDGNSQESFSLNRVLHNKSRIKYAAKRFVHFLLGSPYSVKLSKFGEFKHNYCKLISINQAREIEFDLLLFGSDQIWNPNITGKLDVNYFSPIFIKTKVRASYAASCGNVEEVLGNVLFLEYVKNLDFCGVRESSLNAYLNECGIHSCLNVDPTFLISKKEYALKYGLRENKKKYLLVYELHKNPQIDVMAKIISKEKKLKIVKICSYMELKFSTKSHIFNASPIDFLDLFYNASYVLTNSFHGTAFSIIFRKDFNVLLPTIRASRVVDLLEMLCLNERIANTACICTKHVDYNNLEEKIESYTNRSIEYLKSVIEYAKSK